MGSFKAYYFQFSRCLEIGLELLSSLIIAAAVVMISAEVVSRYFFSKTFGLFEEGPRLFLCFAIFPMLGVVYKKGKHISVDTLSQKLKGRRKIVLELVIDAATIAGSFVLLFAGISGTEALYASGIRVVGILSLPQYLRMLSIPVGAGFLLLFSLESGVKNVVSLATFDDSIEK